MPGIINVRNFAAKGDGRTIDSPAINRAIALAAARGGGTIWVPAGTYPSYSIRLQSHITLHLNGGAMPLAASTLIEAMAQDGQNIASALPPAHAVFQDHDHGHWCDALICSEGSTAIQQGTGALLFYDRYADKHFGAVASRDLTDWRDITAKVRMPAEAKHGTILPIPTRLYARLQTLG